MTKHKAKPEQWAAGRGDWIHADNEAWNGDPAFRCIMELRDRVEALEAAQRPESQNPPEGTRLHSYRVKNSALPIEEWGKGHTTVNLPTHNAPESSDSLVEQVADVIVEGFAPYVTADEPARAAILAVADWFEQQGSHTTAARLRQEVG